MNTWHILVVCMLLNVIGKQCKADDSVIVQGLMLDKLMVEGIVVSIRWPKWHFATKGTNS